MTKLSHFEIIQFIICLGFMLIAARLVGEFFRKFKMPLVVGELIAGVLLGPTLLGTYFPDISQLFYKGTGNVGVALSAITTISVIMLLFVAGMEVDLSIIRKQGKVALKTSFVGLVIPLVLGFFAGKYFSNLLGDSNHQNNLLFSLFVGTAMAVSALPVIARTLMDLQLFRTPIGMIIITAAMFDDLVGWILFSVILGMMNNGSTGTDFLTTLGLTLLYAVMMLTAGRLLINKSLPWAEKNFSWPGGFLSISLGMAFLGAAFTEWLGIHAIFGAFIVGIAVGDSVHVTSKTRDIVQQFVTNIFAPLFFISVGFKVNFLMNFNLEVVAFVLVLAVIAKLFGAGLGALWGGLNLRDAAAVGFGMNARGAMEIILATLALESHLIGESLFVAIVIMAVITSIMAGPMLSFLLKSEVESKTGYRAPGEEFFI